MNYLLWTAVGWGAMSVLAIPLIVRFCRCMSHFDPPVEQAGGGRGLAGRTAGC